MNSKMTTNSSKKHQQLNLKKKKKKKKKQKLSKQLEQEQNQRNGDHMEGFQWGGGGEECGRKVQGIRSIIGRHKVDGGRLRIV